MQKIYFEFWTYINCSELGSNCQILINPAYVILRHEILYMFSNIIFYLIKVISWLMQVNWLPLLIEPILNNRNLDLTKSNLWWLEHKSESWLKFCINLYQTHTFYYICKRSSLAWLNFFFKIAKHFFLPIVFSYIIVSLCVYILRETH